jgi:hypothetical protein
MDTQNTLEAFTILPTTSGNGEAHCRCGCDCEFPLPQLLRLQEDAGRIGDEENQPAKQP